MGGVDGENRTPLDGVELGIVDALPVRLPSVAGFDVGPPADSVADQRAWASRTSIIV